MMKALNRLLLSMMILVSGLGQALSWDGEDVNSGENIEIESGNLVRSGNNIEIYDYGTGNYHDFSVEDIDRRGSTVEIEGYDNTTGEYRTFELED